MNKIKQINISPYNPTWPHIFESEAAYIRSVLGDNCLAIHHIGSTAVPGLSAKEDIDICVVVKKLETTLKDYQFKGEINIPMRYFFNKNTSNSKVNLHMVEPDHGFLSLNLSFVEYLKCHDDDRLAYDNLKQNLLKDPQSFVRGYMGFSHYTMGKYDFIHMILKKAGFMGYRLMHPLHPSEWGHYHRIRKTEIFDADYPGTTTPGAHHFVFYHGITIVGAAYVELINDDLAELRFLGTDQPFQNQDYGQKMLSHLEKWLQLKNYNAPHKLYE